MEEIRYIQRLLREIAFVDDDILPLIPDGIYGDSTRESVNSFQRKYNLYPTGEVDNDTWDKIVEVYEDAYARNKRESPLVIIDEGRLPILPGDTGGNIPVIQAMLVALSGEFDNIEEIEITGTFDADTQKQVERIQLLSAIEPRGVIDRVFLNELTELYNAHITRNHLQNSYKL